MPPPTSIDRLLNYRLWRLLSLSSAPVLRLCEGRYGIARREWALLALVAHEPGGVPPSQLAQAAGIDRAQVSRTCEKLEAKHLVERGSVRGDARRVRVRLTAKGRALYEEVSQQVAQINAQVTAVLDEETERVFTRALDLLTERAAEVNRDWVTDVRVDRGRVGARRRP